jgi:hypothetical protein
MNHVPADLIRRYAHGDEIPTDQLWTVETHLEACAECRRTLGSVAPVRALVDTVWLTLEPDVEPARHRRIPTWAAPAAMPWVSMILLVVVLAGALNVLAHGIAPMLMMLLAPIAPAAAVAVAWSKKLDPAHELISATPRAGMYLVFRRTAAVLVVVVPLLTLGSLLTGFSPVQWLLPGLAFTVGTLALGGLVGINRAAAGLGGAWAVFVVAPNVGANQLPVVLQSASFPVWGLIVAVCVTVLVIRADTYTRMG